MRVSITELRLDKWRPHWPGSTLATGWVEIDNRNGDLVNMGGRIARYDDVDGAELTAFCNQYLPPMLRH